MTEKRVKFNVIRQVPSSYRVENGQILKHMVVISDIRDKSDSDTPIGEATLNDVTHVITPPNITQKDTEVTVGTPTEEDQVCELDFEAEDEVINIYETKDYIILVANMIEKVFLTNKTDDQNNPMLRYQTKTGMKTIPKPTLEQLHSSHSENPLN